jgi:hypothetical protein
MDDQVTKYLEGRYQHLLDFYDDFAARNVRYHQWSSIYVIVVSASLPILISIQSKYPWVTWMSMTLSASVAAVAALQSKFQFHRSWISFRSTWNSLLRERVLLENKIGDYAVSERPGALFVERIEALIDREYDDWQSSQKHLLGKDSVPDAADIQTG